MQYKIRKSSRYAYHKNCVRDIFYMNQIPLTIEQQIANLKSRGMILDVDYTRNILRKISYSRLKGFWWDMIDAPTNLFRANSQFKLVVERYDFDKNLRVILFNAIETIEIALRTKLINILSIRHGSLWYLNGNLFSDQKRHEEHVLVLKREFNRSKDRAVINYKKSNAGMWFPSKLTGENPDSWFIFEYATLGTLSKFYENLLPASPLRSAIANEFGMYISSDFSSWLKSITELRNIIAHHSRLWRRNLTSVPATPSKLPVDWISSLVPADVRVKPYYVISAILYLVNVIDPSNTIKQQILHLVRNHPKINIEAYGFVGEWEREPVWSTSLMQILRYRMTGMFGKIKSFTSTKK